jgi:inosose dehydratase
MAAMRVGCVSITWGKFKRQAPEEWPEERVLAEIAQAGYEGTTAGPRADRSPQETRELYARYGLKPAPGYLAGAFWQPEARGELLEKARRQAAFARAVGVTELFVAPGGDYVSRASGRRRRQLAGHVGPDDGMTEAEYRTFAETLNAVGEATLAEGVRSCLHNHVGFVIETRNEVDRLLALCDPDLVFLGPDTGHLAWGGADVVSFCRDYAGRIKAMHLKDINREIRDRGAREGWEYGKFTASGVFAELGEGFIDFPAVFDILRGAGFSGWLLAETDVTQKPSALESVTISRNYLRSLGI